MFLSRKFLVLLVVSGDKEGMLFQLVLPVNQYLLDTEKNLHVKVNR